MEIDQGASSLSHERKEDLRQMAKNLRNEQQSIVRFADFLACYKHQARQLVAMLTKIFEDEASKLRGNDLAEKRLLYFYVANETIFKTKDATLSYIKAFGDQMHNWIDIFTK